MHNILTPFWRALWLALNPSPPGLGIAPRVSPSARGAYRGASRRGVRLLACGMRARGRQLACHRALPLGCLVRIRLGALLHDAARRQLRHAGPGAGGAAESGPFGDGPRAPRVGALGVRGRVCTQHHRKADGRLLLLGRLRELLARRLALAAGRVSNCINWTWARQSNARSRSEYCCCRLCIPTLYAVTTWHMHDHTAPACATMCTLESC